MADPQTPRTARGNPRSTHHSNNTGGTWNQHFLNQTTSRQNTSQHYGESTDASPQKRRPSSPKRHTSPTTTLAQQRNSSQTDPRVMTHENLPQCAGTESSRSREETVQAITEALDHPDSIPLLHKEPTIEDCLRLSKDLSSESGRCLAWLMNEWPFERRILQPPALGERNVDEEGSTCLHIGSSGADKVTTISVWPWAEKESVKVEGVTPDQMLAAGRWFIGRSFS